MEAPKCKLCGERHYGLCRLQDGETRAKPKPGVRYLVLQGIPQKKTKFDRVAYQREYMRKRRKAQKEQGK